MSFFSSSTNPIKPRLPTSNSTSKAPKVFLSRGQSLSNSLHREEPIPQRKTKSRTLSSLNKTITNLCLDKDLKTSIRLVTMRRLMPEITLIKKQCQCILESNTRENRYNLTALLQQVHSFFSKIHHSIAEAIVLLGKVMVYYKGELIYDTLDEDQMQAKGNGRSKQDIGFLLYGKVQLANQRHFYSHHITSGTLFQDKFLGRKDKIRYFAKVCEPTFILWLPKQSYEVIRKESMLTLDLRYEFGEFENMLKYELISKKLINSS